MTEDRSTLKYPKIQGAAKVEVVAADAIAVEEEGIEMIVATAVEEKAVLKNVVAVLMEVTSQNSKARAEGVHRVQTQRARAEDAEEKDNNQLLNFSTTLTSI